MAGAEVDAVFTANLTHIAPWDATLGLIAGADARLGQGRAAADLWPVQSGWHPEIRNDGVGGPELHGSRSRQNRSRRGPCMPESGRAFM